MAPEIGRRYLLSMNDEDLYGHIAETKARLKSNREKLELWRAGEGQANGPGRFRWLAEIREDEAVLEALGEPDA